MPAKPFSVHQDGQFVTRELAYAVRPERDIRQMVSSIERAEISAADIRSHERFVQRLRCYRRVECQIFFVGRQCTRQAKRAEGVPKCVCAFSLSVETIANVVQLKKLPGFRQVCRLKRRYDPDTFYSADELRWSVHVETCRGLEIGAVRT